MSERDDKLFDELMTEELSRLPPSDQVVDKTNPWKEPIQRISVGLALTTIKVQLLWLDYLLPTVGFLMMFLGLRTLRKENRWFFAGYLLSVYHLLSWVWNIFSLVTRGAPPAEPDLPLWWVLGLVAVQAGQFLLLRMALRETAQKAGTERPKDPLLLLAGLTALMAGLAVSPLAHSWLAAIPTLGFYIYACNALYHLPEKLESAGYALTAAPVRVGDGTCRWAYLLLCLAIVIAGGLVKHHVILDAQPYEPEQTSPVREELAELGFPAEQLSDLPDSELEGLTGARYVDVSQELLMFDPGEERKYNSYDLVYQVVDAPRNQNLDVTSAAVDLGEGRFRIYLFFEWKSLTYGRDHGPFWTDGFSYTLDEAAIDVTYRGDLLYEKEGKTWSAPIPELGREERTATDFFGHSSAYEPITGKVNYPLGADRRRGWIAVDFTLPEDQWLGALLFNYQRVGWPIQLPYQDPTEGAGIMFNRGKKQYYTTFQSLERRQWEQAGSPEDWDW